ncbi:hypothetical protein [uncultured Kordia sp.]|uniref:hypothetical protein n=1 Tax=uncultured Kordia sp. TaxID=507699 RepID=UPI0026376F54|nr:hypothetical protein [uncultured Kordia sp.]
MKDYILLKDVTQENLQKSVTFLVNEMQIDVAEIYKNPKNSDFIITFPKGITNELFIFFYCALMAPDLANSKDLLGWFFANDDLTKPNAKGDDFGKFKSHLFSKRIMITPNGDEKENFHQYGIIETGVEIHFGMDGTYKTVKQTQLNYTQPIQYLSDYIKIDTIQKQEKVEAKGCFASILSVFGL